MINVGLKMLGKQMRFHGKSCVTFLGAIALSTALSFAMHRSANAQGKMLVEIAVYRGPGCEGAAQLPTFEGFLGRRVDRVIDFLDLRSWKILRESAAWTFACWKNEPAKLTISVPMLPKDGVSSLRAGAEGTYDDVFREIARLAVENGRSDAIMRIGWEFNGEWFPWTSQQDPAAFIAYWRRIVTTMRSVAGQNFRFEWCFALADRLGDPAVAYPGDDFVDIVSADVYNQYWKFWLADPSRRWASMLDGQFGLRWHRDFALAHHKAIAFPEWGTGTRPDGHGGGDDPVFVNGMADWFDAVSPLYQGYWDCLADDFDGRLSDGRQPKSAAAFLARFGAKDGRPP
jgi:Glycosyl hydrolase family 26